MTDAVTVLAVDWGASSIRVGRVTFGGDQISADVVHRVAHQPVADAMGGLRWNMERLLAETERGLAVALDRGPVASIGVDTWGVDYGVVDESGRLLSAPWSYRDQRTAGYASIVERIGADALYAISGLQLLPFNTIFQLAVHDRAELGRATHVALLPDLVAHHLAGGATALGTELTAAGTTGLLDLREFGPDGAATGPASPPSAPRWSPELCAAIGLDPTLLPPLRQTGDPIGAWRGVPITTVGAHDTASAVAGGCRAGEVFVATGTWLLVGIEREDADLSPAAQRAGFTNELGTFGGVRFLRNVAGWWMVDECARAWGRPVAALLAEAGDQRGPVPRFDATDERLVAPADMPAMVRQLAGLPDDAPAGAVVRSAVESMAATVARLAATLDGAAPIRAFGGGVRSDLFLDALRRHAGREVRRGPVEATLLGNALTQAVSLGRFADPTTARAALAANR